MKRKRLTDKEFARKLLIGKAAARVFHRNGYLDASLKDISDEAELSKGGIYHYFANKHELLFFVLDTYMDSLLDGLEIELRRVDTPAKKLRHIATRHLALYNSKVPEARALLIDLHNLPAPYYKAIAVKQKAYAGILSSVLDEYFEGRVPSFRVKAIGFILFGMCNSIMHWHDPAGPINLHDITEMCFEIFMKGITQYQRTDQRRPSTGRRNGSRIAL